MGENNPPPGDIPLRYHPSQTGSGVRVSGSFSLPDLPMHVGQAKISIPDEYLALRSVTGALWLVYRT